MSQPTLGPERRRGTTFSKHIKLTAFGRKQIEAWAKANNLNFSAAIETLALLGMNDERADYIIPALRATTLHGLQLTFNRLARLLSDIALDSAVSRIMSEGILLQLIRELAESRPDDFEAMMRVPRDSRRQQDVRVRQFHDSVKQQMAKQAALRLRQSVSQLEELLNDSQPDQPS